MNLVKKTCALIVVFAMMLTMVSTVSAATNYENTVPGILTATVSDGEIKAGETFYVTVSVSSRKDLYGVQFRLVWDPEKVSVSSEGVWDEDEEAWTYPQLENLASGTVLTIYNPVLDNLADGVLTVNGARAADKSKYTGTTAVDLVKVEFKALENISGKVNIGFDEDASYANSYPDGNWNFGGFSGIEVDLGGDVDDKTPAEKINLLTAAGVPMSNVYVTNKDGSQYYVDSALVFVSSVDKGNTPVKTVITCDDFADTKLEIEAAHTQDINGLTYFAAAMSSIKETNYGKTFKATAYVTDVDGKEVVGVPATGIFTK